jgi:hypothetical protein
MTVVRAVTGIAAGGIIPIAMAAIGDRAPMQERQIALGRFLVLMIIGQMSGSACSGLIATHADVDHIQGLAKAKAILKAPVLAHPKAVASLESGDRIKTFAEIDAQNVHLEMPKVTVDREIRDGDTVVADAVGRIEHADTALAAHLERAVLRRLEAGCAAPVAIDAEHHGDVVTLVAHVYAEDGSRSVAASRRLVPHVDVDAAAQSNCLSKTLAPPGPQATCGAQSRMSTSIMMIMAAIETHVLTLACSCFFGICVVHCVISKLYNIVTLSLIDRQVAAHLLANLAEQFPMFISEPMIKHTPDLRI